MVHIGGGGRGLNLSGISVQYRRANFEDNLIYKQEENWERKTYEKYACY
jgi:hypothetical protein